MPGLRNALTFLVTLAMATPLAAAELSEGRAECREVTFGADIATCDALTCVLAGDAFLVCDELKLWADEIEVRWDEARNFSGAAARGNALLVDHDTVLTCETIELDQDRVRGRVEDATLRTKEKARADARGIPQGRDAQILHGDIERPSREELRIYDGDFTLCDCGEDPPSWRIDSPEIEVEVGERALVWWPMLYVSPFGLGPIPVTPPLLPVSVPLKDRALGFLPPRITFYGPLPTFDLPFFFPIGESFDVTVTAGLRTDWIAKHKLEPSRWGAPRAGARVRYAPTAGLTGELRLQWTWDRRLYLANQYLKANDLTGQLANPFISEAQRAVLENRQDRVLARHRGLLGLEHRVSLAWEQDFQIMDDLRWHLDVDWPGDDRLRQDFGVTLTEQVWNYVPSRTQVSWTPTGLPVGVVGSVAADYLVVIGNTGFGTGDAYFENYTNWRGLELHVPHRGPAVRLSLLPYAPAPDVLPGLQLEADAGYTRYGSWDPSDPATLQAAAAEVGVAYRESFGGLNLELAGSGHGTWGAPWIAQTEWTSTVGSAFVHFEASAHATWARRFGPVVHALTPRLAYGVIPVFATNATATAESLRGGADERLDAEPFNQVMLSLDQALWSYQGRRLVSLRVALPFDLEAKGQAPMMAAVDWSAPWIGSGAAWLVADFEASEEPLQELGAQLRIPIGPVTLSGTYFRFAPNAERFTRSIFALFGTSDLPADPLDWVHAVQPGIMLRTERFSLSYAAVTLLPLPGDPETDPPRPFLSQNIMGASYVSPCDCWQIAARVAVPGHGSEQEILDRLKIQVTFAVGDYSIGNQP